MGISNRLTRIAAFILSAIASDVLTVSVATAADASINDSTLLAQERSFDITPQPLASALKKFADQAGLQIMFPPELVKGRTSPAVQGRHSGTQVLQQLLSGTGLGFVVDGMTVAVRATVATSGAEAVNGSAGASIQLARSEPTSSQNSSSSKSSSEPSSAGGESLKLDEIIVTAQKREERAFDVPISIVAMSADELHKRQVTNIDDLSLAVPGLFVQSTGVQQRRIMMRGISNTFGNSSLIGLYLDEASVTASPISQLDLRTYDLERVEVLRGPQGTLYGESSVGGTIRFITKNPVLDQFAMNADMAALFTEDGSPGQRIEGALNVPLIENELGLRISGTFDHQGGWMDQPAADKKDFNDQNLVNVRVKGLWQPVPQFTVNTMAVIHRNDAAPSIGEDANGNFTQSFNLTITPSVKDDYDLYNLTLTYDFSAVRVLSTSTYVNQDKEARNLGFSGPTGPPGTPRFEILQYLQKTTSSDVFSEELRLSSIGSGPWQWTAGGFYRDAQTDADIPSVSFGFPAGSPAPDPFSCCASSIVSKSWAVFGDTNYNLTDRLALGAGLRYFEDDQTQKTAPFQTGKFHALTPRVYALYKLTGQVNTYASVAKGFRSGGFNSFDQPPYDPESVWTYELGTKMSFADGRLIADAAVFFSDYKDYQIFFSLPAPPFGMASNAGNAKIKGIEWGMAWRPTDQWSLTFNGTYVDSEFYDVNAVSSTHVVGDPLDLFPKYGYTISPQRDFNWNGRAGFVRVDYNKHGRSTYRNRATGPWYFSESDLIDMLNFNMSLRWNESLLLSLFAQNLLNDRGFIDPFSIDTNAARSRPRTFGVGFGVTF